MTVICYNSNLTEYIHQMNETAHIMELKQFITVKNTRYTPEDYKVDYTIWI